MRKRQAMKIGFGVLIVAGAFMQATPARATLTQRCNWGVGTLTPTVWPASTQVMMMPTVMDFGSPLFGVSQAAFISFENATQTNRDGGGVLRIIDVNCHEIARFPDTSFPPPPIPAFCPANLNTVPDLGTNSGLAVGNIDTNPDVEIIGVIGGPTSSHKQIIAFNLVGPLSGAHLIPKWCSPPLPGADFIAGPSAPAIAQLDGPSSSAAAQKEIIIDNKVYDSQGNLRFAAGLTRPQSRTVVVANLLGPAFLPQVVTGSGLYQSSINSGNSLWTGMLGWQSPLVTNGPLVYPAVADLDPASGPEIVVTDTMANTLRVLRPSGAQLASTLLPTVCAGPPCPCPGPSCPKCGGPPMIGDVDGIPGSEIGVAGCFLYTVYKYSVVSGVGTLTQLWSKPTNDPGGQTTSTLFKTKNGPRIYYADTMHLWVFNGMNGTVVQSMLNSSATSIEGPVIAAFDAGSALGRLIVVADDYLYGGHHGVRIFDDPTIGPARSYWNQHTYHATNVNNSHGTIPTVEPPNWLNPALNTYRVQQWP